MQKEVQKIAQTVKQHKTPAVTVTIPDQGLAEMVYDPVSKQTAFVLWRGEGWTIEESLQATSDKHFIPYSPENNLIQNEVVLFPAQPQEYSSEQELVAEIQAFIHQYVDVSPLFEKIASYYVLFSWVYDSFNELPYLRLRGDPGSGKPASCLP